MFDIAALLEKSMQEHDHLCPRQILGVRIGLAGLNALGLSRPPVKKQLLVIVETDGCFVDGVIAAIGCTVGHRTLRVEDYGKVAATFVETKTCRAVRVASRFDAREQATAFVPEEPRHYFAQMKAYRAMPDERLLTVQEVILNTTVEQIVSRPGKRVQCDICREEIMNEREIFRKGVTLCRACAGEGYYRSIRGSTRKLNFPAPLKLEQPVNVQVCATPLVRNGTC